MSYIRGNMSSEKLYILENMDNMIQIYEGPVDHGTVPKKIFNGIFKKWRKKYYNDVKYLGAKIYEIEEGQDLGLMVFEYSDIKFKAHFVTFFYLQQECYRR